MSLPSSAPPAAVQRRLDQVVRRIRGLYLLAGCARVVLLACGGSVLLYSADRLMHLPVVVRALLLLAVGGVLVSQLWRRVLRPLVVGVSRVEAARLVERSVPSLQGRVLSALQLGDGPAGSFEHQVAVEAAAVCDEHDLRVVLTARPTLVELLRAAGAAFVLALAVLLAEPPLDVFVSRLLLGDTPWPRDTVLALEVAERSPVHVREADGSIVASRGGVLNLGASWNGLRPERVELVVQGAAGERVSAMVLDGSRRFGGHITLEPGDTGLFVRGGDDDGAGTQRALTVIDPPRLDAPTFVLRAPAYLGEAARTVGPEGLAVPEGTLVELGGQPSAPTGSAELQLLSRAEPVPLVVEESAGGQRVSGSFLAEESDTLLLVLTGSHGLATPDPSHIGLVVHADRPPALRSYSPPRSDIKVSAQALVPFAVVAEDDHGVVSVELIPKDGSPRPFEVDPARPGQYRLLLDVRALGLQGGLSYALEAADGRDLPGRGSQRARLEGRRVDIVEDSEVLRLLADRQLRLKESFSALRDRQAGAGTDVDDLLPLSGAELDAGLVGAGVAQGQVSARLQREARELCAVLEETLTNRLDSGPGAEVVLQRRLADWRSQPVDEVFAAASWRSLAQDYAAGRFGRLDLVGRLLEMAGLALEISEDLSPAAQQSLLAARQTPIPAALEQVRRDQGRVLEALDRLLARMDEWEDYQEIVTLVKALIEDQRSLRERTEQALKAPGGN